MEKLTTREKAILTYKILQKRKIKKAKNKKKMVDEVVARAVKRCNKNGHRSRW
jgi:hypothetical protein